MKHPGFGVMIHQIFGNGDTSEIIVAAHGKRITALRLDDDETNNALHFELEDGSKFALYDNGQSCCENRYMRTDDDLSYYIGSLFIEARIQDAPDMPDEYGSHEVQFLIVATSKGEFTMQSHNEHNGYYGGFAICAKAE